MVLRSRSPSDLQRRSSGEKGREETDGPTQVENLAAVGA